jgi:hypothetical protein
VGRGGICCGVHCSDLIPTKKEARSQILHRESLAFWSEPLPRRFGKGAKAVDGVEIKHYAHLVDGLRPEAPASQTVILSLRRTSDLCLSSPASRQKKGRGQRFFVPAKEPRQFIGERNTVRQRATAFAPFRKRRSSGALQNASEARDWWFLPSKKSRNAAGESQNAGGKGARHLQTSCIAFGCPLPELTGMMRVGPGVLRGFWGEAQAAFRAAAEAMSTPKAAEDCRTTKRRRSTMRMAQ